jgi:hypothetical protein
MGSRTRIALKNFRQAAGLPAGDDLDAATFGAVCDAAGFALDR